MSWLIKNYTGQPDGPHLFASLSQNKNTLLGECFINSSFSNGIRDFLIFVWQSVNQVIIGFNLIKAEGFFNFVNRDGWYFSCQLNSFKCYGQFEHPFSYKSYIAHHTTRSILFITYSALYLLKTSKLFSPSS